MQRTGIPQCKIHHFLPGFGGSVGTAAHLLKAFFIPGDPGKLLQLFNEIPDLHGKIVYGFFGNGLLALIGKIQQEQRT